MQNGGGAGIDVEEREDERDTLLPPLSASALRSHLAIDEDDPTAADKFATNTMRYSARGTPRALPASVHGAPETVQESREVLERLKRMEGFESQDFDPVENDVEREVLIHRGHSEYGRAEFWKWALAMLTGLVMGVLAFLTDWGIELMNDLKYASTEEWIRSGGGNFMWPCFVFMSISAGYALVAGALVSYVEPLAAGSGIPEIKTYLNGVHIKGLLTIRTLISKLVGVMFTIAAGLVAGKEGPFVHGGGIVGGGIGGMGSLSLTSLFKGKLRLKFPQRWGGYFRNDADHRDFTAIGTAAGVATAFASPIGGLLFTIEEGASFYSTSIFWRGFLSTCVGVMSLHVLVEAKARNGHIMSSRFGRYRDFGLYTDSLARYGARYYYYIWDLPIFCLIGAMGGLLGAIFIHYNVKITQFRHRYIPSRSPGKRLLEVLGLAMVTSFVWYTCSYASPCHNLPSQDRLRDLIKGTEDKDEELYGGGGLYRGGYKYFPQLWCSEGQYSVYGQLFMAPMSEALRIVMHLGEPLPEEDLYEFSLGPMITFFGLTMVFMTYTNGVGASTGMFVPSLAVGAAGGRIVGRVVKHLLNWIWPDSGLPVSLTSYSIIGAAAFLGGSTRMTLTTTVMVMETTGAMQLIVPLMLTVFCAKLVGDQFGLGIDDTHIKLRGAPYLDEPALDAEQKMVTDKLTVSELMTVAVVALPPVVKVRHLVETLRTFGHQGFPVTPEIKKAYESLEPFEVHGYIMRTSILRLLKHRIGLFKLEPGCDIPSERQHMPNTHAERESLLEMLEQIPLKVRIKGDQEPIFRSLTEEQLDMWLDLRPFMQRNPFVIQANASLSRAYRLFRTMGIRHLFVGPPQPKVVGMITRKDVIMENAKLCLGRKANQGLAPAADSQALAGARRHQLPFIPYGAYDPTVGGGLGRGPHGGGEDGDEFLQYADDDEEEGIPLNEGERRGGGTRQRRRQGEAEMMPMAAGGSSDLPFRDL